MDRRTPHNTMRTTQAIDASKAGDSPGDQPATGNKAAAAEKMAMHKLKGDAKHYRVEQMSIQAMRPIMRALVRPSRDLPRALVIDPFAGAGTTAVASHLLECDFAGGDTCPFAEVFLPSPPERPPHHTHILYVTRFTPCTGCR